MQTRPLRNCPDCDAAPGRFHEFGCDNEICALCGEQLLTCPCVYVLAGLDADKLLEANPTVYYHGPNAPMRARYRREVSRFGGRIPWAGDWPGADLCAEHGWYVRPVGSGFVRCGPSAPGAFPDPERLAERTRWDPKLRRYVVRLALARQLG